MLVWHRRPRLWFSLLAVEKHLENKPASHTKIQPAKAGGT